VEVAFLGVADDDNPMICPNPEKNESPDDDSCPDLDYPF